MSNTDSLLQLTESDVSRLLQKFPLLTPFDIYTEAQRAFDWAQGKCVLDVQGFFLRWLARKQENKKNKPVKHEIKW